MKPGKGKAKGSANERQVCKRLSLWVSHGKREDVFWRSAMSGGRATVGAKKGLDLRRQAGDISAVAPEGHSLTDRFYIECKHVKDLKLDRFIVSRTGPLWKFWVTAIQEAGRHGRQPMLIVRQNQLPTLVLVQEWENEGDEHVPTLAVHVPFWRLFLFTDLLKTKYDPGKPAKNRVGRWITNKK